MPDDVLLLTDADLRPLREVATYMDAAMDVVAEATLALHRGVVTQANFSGRGQAGGRPSARITFATGDGLDTGIRTFGTPVRDQRGVVQDANSRAFVLLDGESGQVRAFMSYARLNPLRVGAIGGVAARHLAPPGARTLAVLGSGQQARTQVQGICRALPGITSLRVYSPTAAHREAFAQEMASWLDVKADAVGSVEEATQDAPIVAVAASGRAQILSPSQVEPGALVISVTGEGQLSEDFLDAARTVCVNWEALADNFVTREPYQGRIRAGRFGPADVTELTALLAGAAEPPRRQPDDVVVFELTAVGAHDLAIARWVYDWARANHVGTPFSLAGD
jgi:ornithine cyclodeaminase/alanine dehydrogenase-like protein (mu-crystallin family)